MNQLDLHNKCHEVNLSKLSTIGTLPYSNKFCGLMGVRIIESIVFSSIQGLLFKICNTIVEKQL